MNEPVFIGLGSNLGDSLSIVQAAIESIDNFNETQVVCASSLYETAPVGSVKQDNFINAVIQIQTAYQPLALLRQLQALEQQFLRVRKEHWGPRTLDCDLLYYQHRVMHHPDLILPHPHILQRAFVLVPLSEIVPTWQHIDGQSIKTLAMQCSQSDIKVKTCSLELANDEFC